MLDQSFSADNFRRILDYENRKGVYLEKKYFPNIEKINEKIKKCIAEIRSKKRTASQEDYREFKAIMEKTKKELRKEKDEKLQIELQKISDKVLQSKFCIKLDKNELVGEKPIYTLQDSPEVFFASKQIQQNFRKLYKVKQANRFSIVSQIKVLLGDDFPKYVLRTDIEEFYESVPHDILWQKLSEENLLSFYSKKLVLQILKEYKRLSGSDKGLPRGVGISAYLAELYMRDVDSQIKSLPTVSYYARYVDDIIIIFTPTSFKNETDYLAQVDTIVEEKYKLKRNITKTKLFDLLSISGKSLDYLGYHIQFGTGSINLKLTSSKVERYKTRIDLLLSSYNHLAKVNEKKARKLLVKRVAFLTSNTRLINNKKNVLIGVYYSNSLLTDSTDWLTLDQYLADGIELLSVLPKVKQRLLKFKFSEGFATRRFVRFTTNDLSEIMNAWKRKIA